MTLSNKDYNYIIEYGQGDDLKLSRITSTRSNYNMKLTEGENNIIIKIKNDDIITEKY